MEPELLDGTAGGAGPSAYNGPTAPTPDPAESVDDESDDDGDGLWYPDDPGFAEELKRRLEAFERGETELINGPELMEKLRGRFG